MPGAHQKTGSSEPVFHRGLRGSVTAAAVITRAGVRLDVHWQAWEGQVEWVQVARQNRVAAFETASPGYGMLEPGRELQRPDQ